MSSFSLTSPSKPITGWPRFLIIGAVGAVIGLVAHLSFFSKALSLQHEKRISPAAYRVPRIPGGTALRIAMIHDVLHERYTRHGPAWYEHRNQLSRESIAREKARTGPPTEELLGAMDDLAVGLECLHQSDEAAAVMREKLTLLPPLNRTLTEPPIEPSDELVAVQKIIDAQKNLSPLDHAHYTAHANLGTSLIHGAFPKALAGDSAAKAQLKEGLAHIEKSIAINPAAHFGRENWQSLVVRHFLAGLEDPKLLTTYDMLGGPLKDVRYVSNEFRTRFLQNENDLNRRVGIRTSITVYPYFPNTEWQKVTNPLYPSSRPFDEPALGLIGMWTLGGGPNPHSAMALAHIAELVDQRHIAWTGYQRALDLRERFSPNPEVRDALVLHCQTRQNTIAKDVAPQYPDAWQAEMLTRHQAELDFGKAYQKAYHAYEALKIASGVPLNDPHFYDAFYAANGNIASDPGLTDDYVTLLHKPNGLLDSLPLAALGAGLFMTVAALSSRRLPQVPATPVPVYPTLPPQVRIPPNEPPSAPSADRPSETNSNSSS